MGLVAQIMGEAEGEIVELSAERGASHFEEKENLGRTPDLVLQPMVTFVIQVFPDIPSEPFFLVETEASHLTTGVRYVGWDDPYES